MSSGKRQLDADGPRNETSKALFVRDITGELVTVLPGQLMPAMAEAASAEAADAVAAAEAEREATRLAARSEEDIQYDAYLGGRDKKAGNVWIPNAGKASTDNAAFADSISAQMAAEREAAGGGKEYASARAHDRSRKFRKQTGTGTGGSYGGATSVAEAQKGASLAQAALEKAREASDDEDEDEESLSLSAAQLAGRAMAAYNTPISNLPQLDPYGNDLRVPMLERKTRKFLECFAEDASIRTLEGKPVLKDFEDLRKRYATVFRESGAELHGHVHKRWLFEARGDDDGDGDDDDDESGGASFCLDFERHTHLVTPKPGLPLDGSLGVTLPRTQDLVVLYQAVGGEIAGMWIAPDKEGIGADAAATREAVEATDAFKAFRRQVEKLGGGGLAAQFASFPSS